MKIKTYLLAFALATMASSSYAQMELTLDKAVDISIEQSPDLRNSELNLKRFEMLLKAQEASLKSRISLSVDPFKYSNSRYMDSRLSQWYTNESISSMGTLSISQPIVWTGATISLNNRFGWQNNLSTIDNVTNNSSSWVNSFYVTLNQPIFTFNEYKYELLTIEMDYENAQISYAITRLNMEQNIMSQFYSVYMLEQQLIIAQEEIENAKQNYEIISERVKLEMVSRSELFQAELNLSTAESSMENTRLSLENAKDKFKQQLGIDLNEEITTIAQITENYADVDVDLAVQNALNNRLELRQREITNKNAEITMMNVKENNSFDGQISVSFGLMGDDTHLPNVYDTPTKSPSVSVNLSIPIFDWGARRNRIKAQEIQMDMNQIAEDEELLDIEMEVVQSCRTLTNLVRQIEIAKTSLKNAQMTYDLNVEYYRAGEISGMEMNEFQSQLSSLKLSLSQKMVDYKLELLNLKSLSLYDFEKREPISPMLLYSTDSMKEYNKLNEKK